MRTSTPFHPGIRTTLLSSLALVLTSVVAKSASLVQYESFSFLPNANATLHFGSFDTMGGTRTLDSVFIEIGYSRDGGYAQFDNESPGSATVDLTSRIDMFVTSVIDFTKLGSSAQVGSIAALRTSASQFAMLGADDDPGDNNFNYTGSDFFHWDLPEVSASDSGYMDDISQFIGTESFSIDMEGLQSESITGVSGAKKTTSPSSVDGFTRITYNYSVVSIPELGELILGPLGLAILVILRRQR